MLMPVYSFFEVSSSFVSCYHFKSCVYLMHSSHKV